MKEYEWGSGLLAIKEEITRNLYQHEALLKLPIVVVIAGGTCSGKTSLAQELFNSFGSDLSLVISLDNYYKDYRDQTLPRDGDGHFLFDHPQAYRFPELIETVCLLSDGKKSHLPRYDIASNTIVEERGDILLPRPIIIVEGLFSLTYLNDLASRFNQLTIYMEVDYNTALARRLERDTKKYGVSKERVEKKFAKNIWPSHNDFVVNQKWQADIVVKSI